MLAMRTIIIPSPNPLLASVPPTHCVGWDSLELFFYNMWEVGATVLSLAKRLSLLGKNCELGKWRMTMEDNENGNTLVSFFKKQ